MKKNLLPLSILMAGLLCGCNPDKSGDTQVMAPTGGKPYDAPKAPVGNPNVPESVKSSIPGAK